MGEWIVLQLVLEVVTEEGGAGVVTEQVSVESEAVKRALVEVHSKAMGLEELDVMLVVAET